MTMPNTLERLKSLQSVPTSPAETKLPQENQAEDSLSQQLDALYSDIDYLTQKFPKHSIRSLVDYALSLQSRLGGLQNQDQNHTSDYGIIPAAVINQLAQIDQAQADQANVGIVEVDDQGVIRLYNRYESELAGVQKENAIGKNFFTEIAPCTNNRLFFGRFKQGVEAGILDQGFNYTFTYKMRPTAVSIHLYREPQSQRNFVIVKTRS